MYQTMRAQPISEEEKLILIADLKQEMQKKIQNISNEMKEVIKSFEGYRTNSEGLIRVYADKKPDVELFYNANDNTWGGADGSVKLLYKEYKNGKHAWIDSKTGDTKEYGTLTTGYGHALSKKDSTNSNIMQQYSNGISQQQALDLFDFDTSIKNTEGLLQSTRNRNKEKDYILTQNQFDAIFSVIFNSGPGNVNKDLWPVIKDDPYDYARIEKAWLNFNVVDKGIKPRRKAEFNIYKCGEYKLNNGQVIKQSTICQNS